mgnify:CR=1 FL=1
MSKEEAIIAAISSTVGAVITGGWGVMRMLVNRAFTKKDCFTEDDHKTLRDLHLKSIEKIMVLRQVADAQRAHIKRMEELLEKFISKMEKK